MLCEDGDGVFGVWRAGGTGEESKSCGEAGYASAEDEDVFLLLRLRRGNHVET